MNQQLKNAGERSPWAEHHLWYVLIFVFLFAIFTILCIVVFNAQFAGAENAVLGFEFRDLPESALQAITIFATGMLGATVWSLAFVGKDASRFFDEHERPPSYADVFAYLGFVLCGGATGSILFVLVKAGFVGLTVNDSIELKPMVEVAIAAIGGYGVKSVLGLVDALSKNLLDQSDSTKDQM